MIVLVLLFSDLYWPPFFIRVRQLKFTGKELSHDQWLSSQLQTTSVLESERSSSGWYFQQFSIIKSSAAYLKNLATTDTVEIGQRSSLELFQIIEIKWDHGEGEYSYVHDFQDRQER